MHGATVKILHQMLRIFMTLAHVILHAHLLLVSSFKSFHEK